MTEEQYKLLCSSCDSILLADSASLEKVAIPWLHVIREHPIFLKQYEELFIIKSFQNKLIDYLFAIKLKIVQYLKLLWNVVNLSKKFWLGTLQNSSVCDIIFVSHLTNPAQLRSDNDFYFGNVPKELAERGIRVKIVLINHTSVANKVINNSINTLGINRVVISKILPIKEEYKIWVQTKKQAKELFQSYKVETNGLKKAILKKATREAISEGTKTTLRIGKAVGEILRITKAQMIVTTYEGHSWERVIFSVSRMVNQKIQCIAYQHAALFHLQHAAKRSLEAIYNPDVILAAGPVGLGQLKSSEGLSGQKLGILGSSRFLKISSKKNTFSCIILPEGIMEECETLFFFSLLCAKKYPHINFIWRLHPIISFEELMYRRPELRNIPSNIEMSKKSFEYDIARSKWSLYRGSTAIIPAVANGVIPIYLSKINELSIDPLYEVANIRLSVSSINQFGRAVETKNCNPKTVKYCMHFYSQSNSLVLIEHLRMINRNIQ